MKKPNKKRQPLEKQIQHEILKTYGNDHRLRIWRSNSGAMRNPAGRMVRFNFEGCPDLSGFLCTGRAFFIEVKSATGRQTAAQRAFENICHRFNAVYVLARCVQHVETALLKALPPVADLT